MPVLQRTGRLQRLRATQDARETVTRASGSRGRMSVKSSERFYGYPLDARVSPTKLERRRSGEPEQANRPPRPAASVRAPARVRPQPSSTGSEITRGWSLWWQCSCTNRGAAVPLQLQCRARFRRAVPPATNRGAEISSLVAMANAQGYKQMSDVEVKMPEVCCLSRLNRKSCPRRAAGRRLDTP